MRTWGAKNLPHCPVCHAQVDSSAPELMLLVSDTKGAQQVLTDSRVCICASCGNVWLVGAPK